MSAHYLNTRVNTFSANIDGRGYTIYNLTIYNVSSINGEYYAGVFNILSGTIKNIKFYNVSLYIGNVVDVNLYLGGIAGKSTNSIISCYITGRVNAEIYKDTREPANIYSGGVVGYNTGELRDLMLTSMPVNVDSSSMYSQTYEAYVGGVAGLSTAPISGIRYEYAYVDSNLPVVKAGGVAGKGTNISGIIYHSVDISAEPAFVAKEQYSYYSRTDYKELHLGLLPYAYKWSVRKTRTEYYNSYAAAVAFEFQSTSDIYLTSLSGKKKAGGKNFHEIESRTVEPIVVTDIEKYLAYNAVHTDFRQINYEAYEWLLFNMGARTSSNSEDGYVSTPLEYMVSYTNEYPKFLPNNFDSNIWISVPSIDNGLPVLRCFYWEGQVY